MNVRGIGRGQNVPTQNVQYSSNLVRRPPNPRMKQTRMSRNQKRVPQVPRNEFYREHSHWKLVNLQSLKKRIDDVLVSAERKRLFWSAFRNFMTAKISKTEFTRIVQDRIRNPEIIPLFNYFVRSLLHNSRIKHRDPPIAKTFEDFFNTFHQTKRNNREGFGTLVAPSMIDFNRFSIDSTTPGYIGKTYGQPLPSSFINRRHTEEHAIKDKLVRNLVRHSIRNHSPTIPIVLFHALETYLKRIIARVIEFKTSQKNIVRYRNDDLRGIRVGSHHINRFRSPDFPGVETDFHHYKHEVIDAVQRQYESSKQDLRHQDIRKLEIMKRLQCNDTEIYRLRRKCQLSMKTDDISKYLYPNEDSKFLISNVMSSSSSSNQFSSSSSSSSNINNPNVNNKSNNPKKKYQKLFNLSRQQQLQIQQFKQKQKELLLQRQQKQKEEMERRKRHESFSYDELDITEFFPNGSLSTSKSFISPPHPLPPPPPSTPSNMLNNNQQQQSQQQQRMVDEEENGIPEIPDHEEREEEVNRRRRTFLNQMKYVTDHPEGRKFNFLNSNNFGYQLLTKTNNKKKSENSENSEEIVKFCEEEEEEEEEEDNINSENNNVNNNDFLVNDEGYERREIDFFEELETEKLDLIISSKDLLDTFQQNKDIVLPYPRRIREKLLSSSLDML